MSLLVLERVPVQLDEPRQPSRRDFLDICAVESEIGPGNLSDQRGTRERLSPRGCDGDVPLTIRPTGANRNNSHVLGDRGYDAAAIRRGLRLRYIVPLLAMRRTAHGSAWAGGAGSSRETFAG